MGFLGTLHLYMESLTWGQVLKMGKRADIWLIVFRCKTSYCESVLHGLL